MGRVKEIVDRNNRTRTFAYDINDNLTAETWGDGTKLTYTYDKVGNLKSNSDQSSNTTDSYDYDAIYQLTGAATSNSNVRFEDTYDEFGDLTQRQDKQGTSTLATLDYAYNNNHQLRFLTQSGAGLSTQNVEFTYDKLSQLRRVDRAIATNPGHLITDRSYDGAGRLLDINNKFNSTVISNYNYGYDDGNRLSGKGGTDGSSTVAYGNDNQISSVDNATRPDESYSFNALGIRAGWVTDTVDKRRVLNDGTYKYQYDDEGNLTQKKEISTGKVTAYVWDYRNRLSRVNLSDGSIVEYGYDAEDRRVSKKINGVTKEKYVYDGSDIALVVDAGGTIVERYLYGDGTDNVLSVVKTGTTVWSLADRQGSITDLVDATGAVLNHFVYDSFGNRTASTAADFRFGYTGRELDTETGLYYYRARYYDSGLGRFISEDPVGFSAGDTNLYRYVNNSPTNWTDPTGTTISGWLDDALNGVDSFVAGFANVVSFGLTNKIREVLPKGAGKIAKLNQEGLLYNLGTGAGLIASLALNPAGAGASIAKGFAAGYQTVGIAYGALESTGNILSGRGSAWDALNLLPVALHVGGAFRHGGVGAAASENVSVSVAESQQARASSSIRANIDNLKGGGESYPSGFRKFSQDANEISLVSAVEDDLKYYQSQVKLRGKNQTITSNQFGPASAGIVDTKTGEIRIRRNSLPDIEGNPIVPEDLHPKVDDMLKSMPDAIRDGYTISGERLSYGAGSHAEVTALSDALKARSNASFEDFTLYIVRGIKNTKPKNQGLPMVRCIHCLHITNGVKVIPENLQRPLSENTLLAFGKAEIQNIINKI